MEMREVKRRSTREAINNVNDFPLRRNRAKEAKKGVNLEFNDPIGLDRRLFPLYGAPPLCRKKNADQSIIVQTDASATIKTTHHAA